MRNETKAKLVNCKSRVEQRVDVISSATDSFLWKMSSDLCHRIEHWTSEKQTVCMTNAATVAKQLNA